jgi:dihydrolipoamide dehydrogenase
MDTLRTDVCVIGAGSAGMGAFRAAREHAPDAVLVESGPYGTTCARVGCMPSKLLIAAAEAAHAVTHADAFGLHAGPLSIDGRAVMQRVRSERDRFVGFVVEAVERWPGERRVRGHARFLDDHTLDVDGHTRIEASRIVIATGTHPAEPAGWREALGDRLIVNDDVFAWTDLPGAVAVVGGGVIGLELAQALHRLGVRVRLLARKGRLGPLTDPHLQPLALETIGREVPAVASADKLRVHRDGDSAVVRYTAGSEEVEERFDYVLSATGRHPNVRGLDLANTTLPLDARGVPIHDRHTGRIGASHVFIAGDVAQDRPLLHEAADDGRIAGDNAGRYPDVRARPRRTPLSVVFCDPQIMLAGASFAELGARGTPFAIGAASFEDQGRSRVMRKNAGAIRVYGDPAGGQFLGAEMIGPAAEHIGHLLAWSAQRGDTVQQMLDSPFYHPVVEEGVRTALRDLNRNLGRGPAPVERCLDCGPGS